MTLFDTLMFLISRGKTEGLLAKVEILYKDKKLTDDEYNTIVNVLNII